MNFRHLHNVRGFFSEYYLGSVFGRGSGRGARKALVDRQTDLAYARFRRIRERAEGRATDAPTCRERFIRLLLRDVLGFHLGAGENGIHRLFPSAEVEAAGESPLLLVYCGAWDEDLDAGRGKANPMRALAEVLARQEVPYGFLVTGERMRLIRLLGEGPHGAYLEADLAGLDEEEDPESFAAFLKLFSISTFLPAQDGRRPIEEIERESREHAERVSEDLKGAVFRAAESMASGLIADAVARGELASPLDLDEARLRTYRDAALLALYRILFIFYAEARDPRLGEHRLYWKNYSATGLLEDILARPDRTWPENRSFLWQRLQALFRIYDQGLPAITHWEHIPPRGGDFFSRTTPEGKILDGARLSDRQVAQLILELATTTPRRGVGRERISFRELDIESLGAVYEGLLEYEPRITREVSLEVRVQGREYVLSPTELVRLCEQKGLRLVGDFALVRGTEVEGLHPEGLSDETAEEEGEPADVEGEPQAAGSDEEAAEDAGVAKGATARLIRRLEAGAFHFVPGAGRKSSGSFYTPRALVQDLVRHTLGPLIEGKSTAEIERLRVLDPACGSAHFLVEAMRFLGQALHRAYVQEKGAKAPPEFRSTTGQGWDINWRASDEEARATGSEARAWCKRRIAERCLFGVDLNPTAVHLAQVALWIESLAGDRPLTYFQHHIRCGNSLLGSWMERLEEPPLPGKKSRPHQGFLPFQKHLRQAIREAARLRRLIDEVHPEDLLREGIQPESTEEQRYKKSLQEKAGAILAATKLLFDLRSASAFLPEIWQEWDTLTGLIENPNELHAYAQARPWWPRFQEVRQNERFFHWELEFPEIFLRDEATGERQEGERNEQDRGLQRAQGMATEHGAGERDLPSDQAPAGARTLESGFPDAASSRLDSVQHRGGLRPAGEGRLPPSPIDGEGLSAGTGDRAVDLPRPGVPYPPGADPSRLSFPSQGFDAVLGNPPWDKILPNRHEFYGRYDILIRAFTGGDLDRRIHELEAANPGLRAEFEAYRERINTTAAMLKNGGDYHFHEWLIDGQKTGGHQDAFKFFIERAWQLVRQGGRVGFVVPSAIYNNEGCTGLRHLLLAEARVERFYAFENRKKIFPIDSRYKFVSLVFRKGKPEAEGFEAAFMRHDLAELDATARYREPGQETVKPLAAPWIVPIRRQELARLSPGTLAFLEYRSPRDREILLKMYGYDAEGNPVNPRPLLGDQGPGTWNARFYTEFNMTNDRDLWTEPATGKLYNPRQILGPVPGATDRPPYYDPKAWPDIRAAMAEKGFWPLYEGKHIEQFLVDIRPIERWVSLEACEKKYGKPPDPGAKLVFRAIASNTNERTCIAAALPENSCFGHSLYGAILTVNPHTAALVANSLPFDFTLRIRVSANVSPTYLKLPPIPTVSSDQLPPLRTSGACAGVNHIVELEEGWQVLWLANRAVAEAYGLTPEDFEYILSTFPVFARKRPEFFAYLQERVQEWKKEVEGRKVYAPAETPVARAAEAAGAYVTEPMRQPVASTAFQQAAVIAWLVQKLYAPGYPMGRFRVQKLLYLIEAATETGLFTEFRKQAAGPYDPGLRYGGPENIAVRQRRWLTARGDGHFEPGPNVEEALRYAPRYIDAGLAELVLEEFRTFKDETLERWTTVHLAAVELARRGEPATPEAVLAYIRSAPEWQEKLSREEFTPARISDAIRGLQSKGLLPQKKEDQP